jgi:hypothetical protein
MNEKFLTGFIISGNGKNSIRNQIITGIIRLWIPGPESPEAASLRQDGHF